MFIYNNINKLIEKKQKEEKGVTVDMMAAAMGLSISTLNDMKRGKTIPRVDTLEPLCKYFLVSMDYFFDFDGKTIDSSTKKVIGSEEGNKEDLYKKLWEQQVLITELTAEVERAKKQSVTDPIARVG
jgi:transcriptional regulator with XRE-family HTH domain